MYEFYISLFQICISLFARCWHHKRFANIILGTSSICDEKTHEPLISNLSLIVETVVKLRKLGHNVVLVSSGGIAMGLRRLDLPKRPSKLSAVQAIAAVGQGRLISLWDTLFTQLRQPIAQVLITRNDIAEVRFR